MNLVARICACLLLGLLLGPTQSHGQPTGATLDWQTDYQQALLQAQTQGKQVLLNFTGSDWCIWCHRLRDEILAQPAFLDYARQHLILVEVDFPKTKPQSATLERQNHALAETFAVRGYPTIVLVDSKGRELGRTGYMRGGPKTFVRELKRFAAR